MTRSNTAARIAPEREAREITRPDLSDPATRPAGMAPLWKPGQSGNPAGRPRGARSKLSELTLNKLLADFELNGDAVITQVRTKNPTAYLAAVVSLLPKQQEKLDSPFSDLTEDELNLLEHFLKSTRARTVTTIDAEPITDAAPVNDETRSRADVATSDTQERSSPDPEPHE